MLKYKSVLLKISGEQLSGNGLNIDFDIISEICKTIALCVSLKIKIGIVVGGGNFWRGRNENNMDRITADKIGMLATVMNSLAISDELKKNDIFAEVQSSCNVERITHRHSTERALKALKRDSVVIFSGGTGSAFFSTDTAAALRAAEINADVLIKGTNVDGIFDCDPKFNSNAKRYKCLTFDDVISRELKVMDMTSIILCKENNIPIHVCNMQNPYNICLVLKGEKIGTYVSSSK